MQILNRPQGSQTAHQYKLLNRNSNLSSCKCQVLTIFSIYAIIISQGFSFSNSCSMNDKVISLLLNLISEVLNRIIIKMCVIDIKLTEMVNLTTWPDSCKNL